MQIKFIDQKINYDGSQLRSHWIFDTTELAGNAIAAFIGECNVLSEHMVDLVDKNAGCRIYSEDMLHFVVERFDCSLNEMILHQRLFVAILGAVILSLSKDERADKIIRKGNDLYDGDAKLNVSIATASPVSCLMHVGINISSLNTPVKTKGLNDYNINPKTFAESILKKYKEEVDGIKTARVKVRWVK